MLLFCSLQLNYSHSSVTCQRHELDGCWSFFITLRDIVTRPSTNQNQSTVFFLLHLLTLPRPALNSIKLIAQKILQDGCLNPNPAPHPPVLVQGKVQLWLACYELKIQPSTTPKNTFELNSSSLKSQKRPHCKVETHRNYHLLYLAPSWGSLAQRQLTCFTVVLSLSAQRPQSAGKDERGAPERERVSRVESFHSAQQ